MPVRSKPERPVEAREPRSIISSSGSKKSSALGPNSQEVMRFAQRGRSRISSAAGVVSPRKPQRRETQQQRAARAQEIAGRLKRAYPDLKVPLTHRNTFELLVAVILSA